MELLRGIQERAASGLPSSRGKGPGGRRGRGKGGGSRALSAWQVSWAREEEEEEPVLDRRGTEIPGTEAPCPVHADDFLACFAVQCIRRIL